MCVTCQKYIKNTVCYGNYIVRMELIFLLYQYILLGYLQFVQQQCWDNSVTIYSHMCQRKSAWKWYAISAVSSIHRAMAEKIRPMILPIYLYVALVPYNILFKTPINKQLRELYCLYSSMFSNPFVYIQQLIHLVKP